MRFLKKDKMSISMIWIGDPKPSSSKRQDIDSAIKLSEKIDTSKEKVIYWCLDKHVNAFKKDLSSHGVEVRGCESYLKSIINGTDKKKSWLAKRALHIVNEMMKIGRIREKVNIKNIMSLVILYLEGGYTIDANVSPNGEVNFEKHDCFKIPFLYDKSVMEMKEDPNALLLQRNLTTSVLKDYDPKRTDMLLTLGHDLTGIMTEAKARYRLLEEAPQDLVEMLYSDVWMMYSPPGNDTALRALENYIFIWPTLMDIFNEEGDKMYYPACRSAIMGAVTDAFAKEAEKNGVKRSLMKKNYSGYWCAVKSHDAVCVVDEVGISKQYTNSHTTIEPRPSSSKMVPPVEKDWWEPVKPSTCLGLTKNQIILGTFGLFAVGVGITVAMTSEEQRSELMSWLDPFNSN